MAARYTLGDEILIDDTTSMIYAATHRSSAGYGSIQRSLQNRRHFLAAELYPSRAVDTTWCVKASLRARAPTGSSLAIACRATTGTRANTLAHPRACAWQMHITADSQNKSNRCGLWKESCHSKANFMRKFKKYELGDRGSYRSYVNWALQQ
jgi:hypothetical protein